MTDIQQVDVNGVTVTEGTEFELQAKSGQLADRVIERKENYTSDDVDDVAEELVGATLTVESITQRPDGTHLNLTTPLMGDEPVPIMQFAIRNLLQDDDLRVTETPSA